MANAWTLDEAIQSLNNWKEAEKACASGQSYKIGSRSLNRANLSDIAERINFWAKEVERLSGSGKRGARIKYIIPRDF